MPIVVMKVVAGVSVVWFKDRELKKDGRELSLPKSEPFRERSISEYSQVFPMYENLGRGVKAELVWWLRPQQFQLPLNVR